MLHNISYVTYAAMSIGSSGRIVIEVEPDLKQELHAALRKEGTNLKAWFLENAQQFLSDKSQMALSFEEASIESGMEK